MWVFIKCVKHHLYHDPLISRGLKIRIYCMSVAACKIPDLFKFIVHTLLFRLHLPCLLLFCAFAYLALTIM